MKKLTETVYKKIVTEKILQTGLYNGRSVEEAEVDDELFEHLQEIKKDYKKGILTLINADAQIAHNFLKFEDGYYESNLDDLYGSKYENQTDIETYFRGY